MSIEELMAKYYPPTKLVRKAGLFDPGTPGSGTFWEPMYGAKAWSWLNEEANIFAILPKEPWTRTGWRCLTTRAETSGGGVDSDTDAGVPDPTTTLTFYQMRTQPKTMAHSWEVGELVEFLSGVDDAISLLPAYREQIGKDHAYVINYYLGVRMETTAAGDNFESIDRIVSSQDEIQNNAQISDAESNLYTTPYNLNSATTWDSQVNHNGATDRDLTLTLIDTVLQTVWDAGGQPKVLLTGTESLMRWQQLLEAERRFMDTARIVPTFGGVKGLAPGVEAGFMVATYHGIPILTSQHVPDHDTIESIYYLDTDFIKFATAKPTVYSETSAGKDFMYLDKFKFKGLYETMGELRCYRFNAQGKLTDLQ